MRQSSIGFRGIVRRSSRNAPRSREPTLTILTLAVIAILVFLNFVGFRHHKLSISPPKSSTRSPIRPAISSAALKQDLTVARFDKNSNPAFNDLMAEYKSLQPAFQIQIVDPQQKPEVAQDYGATHMGDVVVASGVAKEHLEAGGHGGDAQRRRCHRRDLKVTSDKVKKFASSPDTAKNLSPIARRTGTARSMPD